MQIQPINTEIIKAYFHAYQPDIPQKSAQEMKEFFDAMPKKVLIPKLNELIDELNSGGYGKSAYDIALENGFEGSEEDWLTSLVGKTGKTGPKGDKGADATVKCDDVSNIITEGIYLVDGEYYLACPSRWDTSLDAPIQYTGSANLLDKIDWNYNDSVIPNADKVPYKETQWGVPLLKYENTLGDGRGATYILLRWDNTTLLVYTTDLVDAIPYLEREIDLTSGELDLSGLITQQATFGLGEDICGNFAKISKYFKSGLEISRIPTSAYGFTNALKGAKSGVRVALDDVCPIPHTVKVRLESKNLIPFPYHDTTMQNNGVTYTVNDDGGITVNGTATAFSQFQITKISGGNIDNLLVDGNTYFLYGGEGASMVLQYHEKSTGENKHIYGGQSFTVDKSRYVYDHIRTQVGMGATKNNEVVYPQLVKGTNAGEFTISTQVSGAKVKCGGNTAVADDNGYAEFMSAYPEMTLETENNGIVINAEYNRDINKVIAKLEGE